MKKIFFILVFSIGFFVEAEKLQDVAFTINTGPEMDTSVLKIPEMEKASEQVEVEEPKRSGFASSGFGVMYSPSAKDFIFNIMAGFGGVIGKLGIIADAGIFEGMASIDGAFSGGTSRIRLSAAVEINFIKNNGINKMIPGVNINVSLSHLDAQSVKGRISSSIGGGFYLKTFVSGQVALVPQLEIAYTRSDTDVSGLKLGGGLGLRTYF